MNAAYSRYVLYWAGRSFDHTAHDVASLNLFTGYGYSTYWNFGFVGKSNADERGGPWKYCT